MTFFRYATNWFERIEGEYNNALNNNLDWWFNDFYEALESEIYDGIVDGTWTLKEVEEYADTDDGNVPMVNMVATLFARMSDEEPTGSTYNRIENKEVENRYEEFVADLEAGLQADSKD